MSDSEYRTSSLFTPLTLRRHPRRMCIAAALAGLLGLQSLHAAPGFVRGDANQNGVVDIADAVFNLSHIFLGGTAPRCLDTADSNDDGSVNISDPIHLLNFLFLGGEAIPAPFPACGPDATADQLGCAAYVGPCTGLQGPLGASALSNHYVVVRFDEPVSDAALNAAIYRIEEPTGTTLRILEARLDPNDERNVILATESQSTVEYSLSVDSGTVAGGGAAIRDGDGGGGVGPNGSIVFQGSDDAEPRIVTAISLGSTETEGKILLTYSEPVEEGALDIRFYKISDPDLDILGAEFSDIGVGGTTVILTTDPQRNLEYTVKVTNVKSRAGDFLVDPTRNTVTFFGIPPVDTDPPKLLSAVPTSNTTVILSFNEPLFPGADDPRNYVISCFDPFTGTVCPDLVVSSAELTTLNTQVILTTLSQMPAAEYTVVVENRCGSPPERDNCVQDLQENPIDPNANSALFLGLDRAQPFLSSAVSLGPDPADPDNRARVLLTFSEPVREGAENIEFYSIDDPDLDIFQAELSDDGLTVILTTEEQENIEYTVKVTNVQSRGGAYFIDPTRNTATFGGIPPVDTTQPRLMRAVPTTNTTVILSFSEPLLPGADDPRNYSISCFDALNQTPCADLVVSEAELTMFNTQVILTTLAQMPAMRYTVVVGDRCAPPPERNNCVQDMQENPIDPNGNSASFVGLDRAQPFLSSAISLGPDPADPDNKARVLLTFSEPVLEGAENVSFYSIDAPDLDVLNAALSPDGYTVVLTTEAQENIGYTVKVTNVQSRADGFFIDPTRNTAPFVGIPPVDIVRPRVRDAVSTSATSVIVSFSEPLLDGADDPLNFRISCRVPGSGAACGELVVTGASLSMFNTQVVLTTGPQNAFVVYTVEVLNRCQEAQNSCVQDLQENPIDPGANSESFTFAGSPAFSDELPRVVGAISTGNKTVVIQFSRPMADNALDSGKYFIVQENVLPEVGNLVVVNRCVGGVKDGEVCGAQIDCMNGLCEGPRFLGPDRLTIELKTLSQNEVTYSITAINVTDLSGNPIAPPTAQPGGVIIDPRTTTFPGTPPGSQDLTDTDGDGLTDNVEQRGWLVTIELVNKTTVEREVTSSPFERDTDGDGLDDLEELNLGTDPRNADTDGDELDDEFEYNVIYSENKDQDTDDDGVSDALEVEFFRTNANLADSDGDGFSDDQELFELNRDPRVADLPEPEIDVDRIVLRIDERFTFTNEEGESESQESSTSSTFERSRSTQLMRSSEQLNTGGFEIAGSFGLSENERNILVNPSVSAEFSRNFQVGVESAQSSSSAYESSLSKGFELTSSRSVTREVFGARMEAFVSLDNLSNVAFSLSNLEITVSATDPQDRTSLVPVATLIPNSTLLTGEPAVFNIGALDAGRGPILFASQEVFPNLVEDLLRDPRGLVLDIANFDVEDEFGRNFAFTSQMARDRTVGVVFDFGDGEVERFLVAAAPVRNNAGEIVGGFRDFEGFGPRPAVPLGYILEEVLLLPRSTVTVPRLWSGNSAVDSRPPDAIRAGVNGVSESIARGDDLQLIPGGIDGLPEETIIISAGENGVLDTTAAGDDVPAVVSGFSTTRTCGSDTTASIKAGPNGTVETIREEGSDDDQLRDFGTTGLAPGTDIIATGDTTEDNGFIDTAPQGDDVFVGPGIPCDDDGDCPDGTCDGQEILFRLKDRERGQFGRFWTVLLADDSQLGADFDEIVLRPGEITNLGFVQDRDRDGLIARQEFLFGSSDEKQDTDSDGLDDLSEATVGWEIQVAGSPIQRVFPDPRLADSDFDGLTDKEEQDIRLVQCECVSDSDPTQRSGPCPPEGCASGESCKNVADVGQGSLIDCSSDVTANRTDPRRQDTDSDGVGDADEVRGFLTGAAILDPEEVIVAGDDRTADTVACPDDVCVGGGIDDGKPCRFDRDCGPRRTCVGGGAGVEGRPCVSDIDCSDDPANPGLCEDEEDQSSVACEHEPDTTTGDVCDDVQVVAAGATGLDPNTVVVAPGPDGEIHSSTALAGDDTLVSTGDGVASSEALGDDEQFAPFGESLGTGALGRTIVRPGFDGVFQALPGGDDVLALGQRIQTTDPLDPDTDVDLLSDGFERLLGSDPRLAADGRAPQDSDGDGLFDGVEESTGWTVTVNGGTPRRVFSNPQAPDSDLDGVPDLAERLLGLDPQSADTDGDDLDDFDELSADQFTELARFNDVFPSFFIDGSTSETVGTDPLLCDTDGDGLSDGFEVLTGWGVRVLTDRGVDSRQVFSDPLLPDTDFDGLSDGGEFLHTVGGSIAEPTDPTAPDTDEDDRLDGSECTDDATPPATTCSGSEPPTQSFATCSNTDPLVDDLSVKVTYASLVIVNSDDGFAGGDADFGWELYVQWSSDSFPGTLVRETSVTDCPGGSDKFNENCLSCTIPEGNDVVFSSSSNSSRTIKPSEGFLIHGEVNETDGCLSDGDVKVHLVFFRSFSFEQLQPGFSTEVITLVDQEGDFEVLVVVEILVE